MAKFRPETEIPKNVKLTEEYIKKNKGNVQGMLEYFLNYPDLFLDMITPSYSNFHLFFYQRICKSPYAICRA